APALASAALDEAAPAHPPLRAARASAAPALARAPASAAVVRAAAQELALLRAARASAAPARASELAARAEARVARLARASSALRGWDVAAQEAAQRAAVDWVADAGRRSARARSRARLHGSHRAAPVASRVPAWQACAAAARQPLPWDCARRAAR